MRTGGRIETRLPSINFLLSAPGLKSKVKILEKNFELGAKTSSANSPTTRQIGPRRLLADCPQFEQKSPVNSDLQFAQFTIVSFNYSEIRTS